MIRPKAVIWDFNGTIMDDVELAAGAISRLLARRGLPTIDPAAHRRVFRFPVSDYYRSLGVDLDTEHQADVSDEFHEAYLAGVPDCRLNAGVRELLDHFQQTGADQYVLSAAEEAMVISWAEGLGVSDYFRAIYGLKDRLAATKKGRARDLVRDFALDTGSTLFIGDTDHDVAVARQLGCHPVLVLQGHQDRDRARGLDCELLPTFHALLSRLTGDRPPSSAGLG